MILRRLFAALSFVMSALLIAPPSTAQTNVDKENARAHFERGTELVREQLWDAALAEFLASRALFRTRGNTRNAAVCLRELQRFDEALDMLDALLAQFPDLSGDERAAVDAELTLLRTRVGTVDVRAGVDGASVQLDQRERGVTPLAAAIRVPIGTHVVRVRKDGYADFETRIEVAGAANVVVEATLRPLSQPGRSSVLPASGQRQGAPATLDGDPNNGGTSNRARFVLSADGALAVGPPLGGDVAGCSAPCSARLSSGAVARLHAGLEYPSGLGFSVDVGYLSLVDEVSGRAIDVQPTGSPSLAGIANDQLLVRGLVLGTSGSARFGSDWPLTLRLGVGALLGSLDDERISEFPARGVAAPLRVESPTVHSAYVAPEVRIGRRFGEHFELDAGVTLFLLLALARPQWTGSQTQVTIGSETASYGTQSLTGALLVVASPSIGAKLRF